jgi:hypothetical protein
MEIASEHHPILRIMDMVNVVGIVNMMGIMGIMASSQPGPVAAIVRISEIIVRRGSRAAF